jgi:hypothetical protein
MGDSLPPGLAWEEAGVVASDGPRGYLFRARLAWGYRTDQATGKVTASGPLRPDTSGAARDLAKMRRNLFAIVRRTGQAPVSPSRVLEGIE